MPLFWINYRHLNGRLSGADRRLDFAGAIEFDEANARKIPADMIGRFLDDDDLRELLAAITSKKPAAPSVRRRTAAKRRVGKR